MLSWYADGGMIPVILGGMALEAVILVLLFRRTGQGVPPRSLLPGLGAGACLIGGAGLAMQGTWWVWTGLLLLAGGLLHAVDLRGRWQHAPRNPPQSRANDRP